MQAGFLDHTLPLKRLDHLAVVAHDLEEKTRFWTDVPGVPVAGEVATPTLVIGAQANISEATFPATSVSRKSRPAYR